MTPEKRARLFVRWDQPKTPDEQPRLNLNATPEEAAKAWRDQCRNAAKHLPPWAYHRDWLNGYALSMLPAVCAALGTGEAIAFLPRPAFWPECEPGRVIAVRATPQAWHLLLIDRASGFWMEPTMAMQGPDLISLTEKRSSLSTAKAAWKLARICGLKRPMP